MIDFKTIAFPVSAILCGIAFLYRSAALFSHRRDTALTALLAALAFKCVAFTLSIPDVSAAVDDRTGVPNLAALGIHTFGGPLFGAAMLVVIAYWVHPPERAAPRARLILLAAAAVLVSMVGLWLAASIGVTTRSAHFLLQNTGQPLVMAYLLLYVLSASVALVEITRLCVGFAGGIGDVWLRVGLRFIAVGAVIYLGYYLNRLSATVAGPLHLQPLAWEFLTPVATGIGMPLIVVGLTMPSWGPSVSALRAWLSDYRDYRALYPLWRDVCGAVPAVVLDPPNWSPRDLHYKLYRRVIEIRDGWLALRPYMHTETAAELARTGREAGLRDEELRAAVEASQLTLALRSKASGDEVGSDYPPDSGDDSDLKREIAWLVLVSQAYVRAQLTRSP